jgi:selenocysteine lyase/cysteine desulfurase
MNIIEPQIAAEAVDHASFSLRDEIVGADQAVPLLDGSLVAYVNLDNAASTPALRRVKAATEEAMTWYSSVHRGSGFKSLLSTQLYEEAREITARFVGANPRADAVIFCKNTTEAINRLAAVFPFQPGDIVLTTAMEHHSNDLPWRARARVLHAETQADGALDLDDFQKKLEQHSGKIRLVSVTGASNVTGYLPPIYDLAEMAHRHGALILVDCAQLLPHRSVDMGPIGSARRLDFIAFSAHKIYAPLGSGGLIGEKAFFNRLDPDARGGGTVELVTLDEVDWTDAPERNEAGSPNVIGAVALAAALQFLSEVGMDRVAAHEAELTRYALTRLDGVKGVQVFGSRDPSRTARRAGVIPFALEGISHGKAAAILGFEGGVGVRDGCFCAHPYILRLLGVTDEEHRRFRERVIQHNRADLPGLLRMSFGCYSNTADVDRLVEMLERVLCGDYAGEYRVHERSGSYYPKGFEPESIRGKYFQF